ncbi:MAG: glycoside hydrolase family 3 N-terminal domain-containing protein [Candidatus Bathyarchaeia archaeon]
MRQSINEKPIYFDPNQPIDKRIEDLLSRMTLEEKIGQMTQYSGITTEYERMIREGRIGSLLNVFGAEETNRVQKIAVEESRLGIPLIFGLDVLHGYKTIFPIPLGLASTWDPDIVKKVASIAAAEASADGIHWTFAPMVDIARDPRWGRIAEGAGEDPYLGSIMAKALVEGFQGENLSGLDTIVACPKHYVAYGGAEGGRDYNTVDISEQTLREIYMPPFKAAVKSGAGTIMSAFNDLNGVPASANSYTLKVILRGEWGFDGFVVSDWNAIGELINHGVAADAYEAAEKALTAGVDMDMVGDIYRRTLLQLVREGKISEEVINDSVRRIIKIKLRLGLFERPYVDPERAKRIIKCKEHVEAALEAARKSIVLLKNEGNILPLNRDIDSIAVIGPLANDRETPLGPWSCLGSPEDVVTVLEGIKSKLSRNTRVLYAKGCDVEGTSKEGFREAVEIARQSKVAIVVVGESRDMSGEAACRAYLDLPGVQEDLLKEIYATGVPIIMVLMNGRPLSISWAKEHIPAIIETWFLGIQAGYAIADVIFGDYNPGGKLPVTFPHTVGQVPIYYNHKNTGRPPLPDVKWTSKYLDAPYTPLFPFGHGLSYTKFEYDSLEISPLEVGLNDVVNIRVKVKNVGNREGDEVVQLYVRDLVASVTRPVKELKGFRRITLMSGEEKTVEFTLTLGDISFLNQEMKRVVEPGEFKVMIGSSSEDIRLTGSFRVKEYVEFPYK